MLLPLLVLFLTAQSPPGCSDLVNCRTLALEAHERKDYETFHDLAWAAYRAGRANDAALMLLVARAQSLSGRPGDALVMLERLVPFGAGPPEIAVDPDFERVRALPRWDEVRQKLLIGSAGSVLGALPDASPKAATPESKPSRPPTPRADVRAKDPVSAGGADTPAVPVPAPPAPLPPHSALKFTTVLTPTALVFDGVSKRFIVADRKARRIAVIDQASGQVSTLVGAQGDLGEIGGMTIDPKQGDLWAVSSAGDGAQHLHRIQLISGRVLRSVPLVGVQGQIVALAFVPDAGLVAADDGGRMLRVRPGGRSEPLAEIEYVPRALAADARGRLYVSAGGPRLARFTVGTSLRRTDLVELEPGMPTDAPIAVADGRLYIVVAVDGAFEIRSAPIR